MADGLSTSQSAALLDILTHHDTYSEIRKFRDPGRLKQYGPPFIFDADKPSTSPALQTLLARFLLTLPGLRDVPSDFWKVHCYDIIESFEDSNLSESYDKGLIGSRKTLATAVSALIEYPVRGTFAGFSKVNDQEKNYDLNNAEDLSQAFRDFASGCIYGNVLDDVVKKAVETDNLEEHTPLVKGLHEFVLVNLASFMHYTLILSPKGQYLLKLVDNANKLIPYMVVKQTLKIGNVASMINAMIKVVLAKMSVASLTNWVGLTKTQDEGQNLMQHIISTVLNWDIKDLESRAVKLERERADPGKEQLRALRAYCSKPQDQQDQIRKRSQKESISIVTAVLRDAKLESQLTEPHHMQALEYLGIQLSIRDRTEIIQTLCHSSPDHLTQAVRQLVSAYDPIIRQLHNAVNLSSTVGDLELFLKDMIKLAKVQSDGKDGKGAVVPTVGDFVQLLRKHQFASHSFIHQCCKNGKELTAWYLDWAKLAASHFEREVDGTDNNVEPKSAGDLTEPLNDLFLSLPPDSQIKILPILDAQAKFIDQMHSDSLARLKAVLDSPFQSKNPAISKILSGPSNSSRSSSRAPSPSPNQHLKQEPDQSEPMHLASNNISTSGSAGPTPHVTSNPGPGAYLTRWQDLLSKTPITPLTQKGQIKRASSPEIVDNSAVDVDGEKLVELEEGNAKGKQIEVKGTNEEPDVGIVVKALGEGFGRLLASRGCYW